MDRIKTSDLWRKYERDCIARNLSPKTIRSYEWAVHPFPEYWPTQDELQDAFISADCGFAAESKRNRVRAARTFTKWVAENFGLPDPAAEIPMPKKEDNPRRIFTPFEFSMIWQACRRQIDKSFVIVLFGTGIRIGELPQRRSQVNRGSMMVTGKTGRRQVPITQDVQRALDVIGNDTHIWVSPRGPMTLEGMHSMWDRIVIRAGITGAKRGPHTARHTFATTYLQNGAPLAVVQLQLGHKDMKSTAAYLHPTWAFQVATLEEKSPLRRGLADPASVGIDEIVDPKLDRGGSRDELSPG